MIKKEKVEKEDKKAKKEKIDKVKKQKPESKIKQSIRISKIIDICPPSKVVADIGCDHGNITAGLLLNGKASRVVATDISLESLNKALLLCERLNLLPYVSFRQGEGFQSVSKHDGVKVAIIAGMGGREIMNILGDKKKRPKKLVLQPMNDEIELRDFLIRNKYKIVTDYIFEDGGIYYTLIYAVKGRNKRFKNIYYFYGRDNFLGNNETFIKYLRQEEEKIVTILLNMGVISEQLNDKYAWIKEALIMCKQEPYSFETQEQQVETENQYDENITE